MTPALAGQPAESILVQLTRLEGKVDRIGDRVDDLRIGARQHRIDIDGLMSLTQTLHENAAASKETAAALALTLSDAKDTQEATAKAVAAKSAQVAEDSQKSADRSWMAYPRFISATVALVAVVTLYLQLKSQ